MEEKANRILCGLLLQRQTTYYAVCPQRVQEGTKKGVHICGHPYSPIPAAALSRNMFPSRMYRRTIMTDLCPVWAMMARSLFPAAAALVARPARREWPANFDGSYPAAAAQRLTIRATALSDSRLLAICPCLLIGRKMGPA